MGNIRSFFPNQLISYIFITDNQSGEKSLLKSEIEFFLPLLNAINTDVFTLNILLFFNGCRGSFTQIFNTHRKRIKTRPHPGEALDISNNYCGAGLLPALNLIFARCLLDISNNYCGAGILPAWNLIFARCLWLTTQQPWGLAGIFTKLYENFTKTLQKLYKKKLRSVRKFQNSRVDGNIADLSGCRKKTS
ncbi:MAG: hypothetical protein RLZZ338_3694 [Cyanobacteriota bacterium]